MLRSLKLNCNGVIHSLKFTYLTCENLLENYLDLEYPYRRLHRSNQTTVCYNISQMHHLVPNEQIVKFFYFNSLLFPLQSKTAKLGDTNLPKH